MYPSVLGPDPASCQDEDLVKALVLNKAQFRSMDVVYLDVPLEVDGSMVRINGSFHLLINRVFLGVIAHRS